MWRKEKLKGFLMVMVLIYFLVHWIALPVKFFAPFSSFSSIAMLGGKGNKTFAPAQAVALVEIGFYLFYVSNWMKHFFFPPFWYLSLPLLNATCLHSRKREEKKRIFTYSKARMCRNLRQGWEWFCIQFDRKWVTMLLCAFVFLTVYLNGNGSPNGFLNTWQHPMCVSNCPPGCLSACLI